MKARSSEDRIKMFEAMAKDGLRKHEVIEDEPWGWRVGQPGNSIYMAYVIVMGRFLIVQGDVDLVGFAYCDSSYDRKGVLSWIANSSISYVAEKARIGMTDNGKITMEYDAECALDEAHWHFRQAETQEEQKMWTRIAHAISRGDDEHDVQQLIYDETNDPDLCSIGNVPAARVVWAWLICKKLYELVK